MRDDDGVSATDDLGIFYFDIGDGRALSAFGAADFPVELEQFATLGGQHAEKSVLRAHTAAESAEKVGAGRNGRILDRR